LISVSSMTETLVPKNYRAIIDQLTKENGLDEVSQAPRHNLLWRQEMQQKIGLSGWHRPKPARLSFLDMDKSARVHLRRSEVISR
jgi:hypothetical protein